MAAYIPKLHGVSGYSMLNMGFAWQCVRRMWYDKESAGRVLVWPQGVQSIKQQRCRTCCLSRTAKQHLEGRTPSKTTFKPL